MHCNFYVCAKDGSALRGDSNTLILSDMKSTLLLYTALLVAVSAGSVEGGRKFPEHWGQYLDYITAQFDLLPCPRPTGIVTPGTLGHPFHTNGEVSIPGFVNICYRCLLMLRSIRGYKCLWRLLLIVLDAYIHQHKMVDDGYSCMSEASNRAAWRLCVAIYVLWHYTLLSIRRFNNCVVYLALF